jgi:hypothetical protein
MYLRASSEHPITIFLPSHHCRPDFTTRVEPDVLSRKFLHHVRDAASSAREGERIFVLVLAHGNQDGMVEIGEHLVSSEELEGCFAGAPQGVKVTILLTGCRGQVLVTHFHNASVCHTCRRRCHEDLSERPQIRRKPRL